MATTANIEIVLSSGAKAGNTLKELQQTANRLNREIKDLKPGSEEFVKKAKDYQQVTGRLKDVRNEVRGVTKAHGGLLSSFSNMLPFSGQIQQIAGGFNALSGAVGGTTRGFRILKTAIAATGIGLLITSIAALVAMFKSSEEGQDRWNKIMKVTGVIVGNLSDILADFGDAIFKAFENPKEAVIGLWEVIKTNIINRITGFIDTFKFLGRSIQSAFELDWEGVKENAAKAGESVIQSVTGIDNLGEKIANGFNSAKDAVKGFVDETAKEIEQAKQVADLEAQTNRLERQLLVERKQIEAEVAELRLKARQEDQFGAEARLKFLNEANTLQQELLEKDTIIATNRYEIIRQTNQFSKSTKENLDAEAEAQARLAEVEVTRYNQARQIERERQRIRKEIERDEKAEMAAQAKLEAELQKEIEEQEAADHEKTKERLAEINELRKQHHEDQLANLQISDEAEKLAIEELYANRLISEEEFNKLLIDAEQKRLSEKLEITKAYYGEESEEAKKTSNEIRKLKLDETNYLTGLEEQKKFMRMSAATGTLGFLTGISGDIASLYDKESQAGKEAAIFAARLQVLQSAISAYASVVQIPIVGPTLAPLAAAAALAFGTVRVEAMKKTQKRRAERGMVLRGPSHAQGGIPIEAEGDEIILTKGVYRSPIGRAIASDLNAAYGGIRFMESGGPVNPLSPAQTTATAAFTGGSAAQPLDDRFDMILQYMQKVDTWQSNLKVNNNVQDTREGINVINKLENDASF